MIFKGQMQKKDRYWHITVPAFEISTQGKSKKDALLMIEDAIECHIQKKDFKAMARLLDHNGISISSNQEAELISLFLKRQRQLNDLTVRDLAKRLGYSSASAYAQYESGKHLPGLDKISRFLIAMNPNRDFALELVATA